MHTLTRNVVSLLLIALLFLSLFSCGTEGAQAMEYRGIGISEGMYRYWLSYCKTAVLKKYNQSEDNASFWNSELKDGMTAGEYVERSADTYIKTLLVSKYIFNKNGYRISDGLYSVIDEDINEKISAAGGRSAFESEIEKYGIDTETLKQIYVTEEMANAVRQYLFGKGGESEPTSGDMAEYYEKNYFCLKVIPLYNSIAPEYDEDGNVCLNEDGSMKYRDLSEDEKTRKSALIHDIAAMAANGGDIDALVTEYAEKDMSIYPDGIILSAEDRADYAIVFSAADGLDTGGCAIAEDGYMSYIIYKDELPSYGSLDEKTLEYISTLADRCAREKYETYFSVLIKDVDVNAEITEKYSVIEVPRLSGGI